MRKKIFFTFALILSAATSSFSGGTCTAKIGSIFTEGYNTGWPGDVIITVKSTSALCNGGNFVIENAQAGKATVLSNALAAAAQGKDVSINWLDAQKKDVYAKIQWFSVVY